MVKKKLKLTYLISFIGQSTVIGKRNLTQEEIEAIINTIAQASEAIQGIKYKFKLLKKN